MNKLILCFFNIAKSLVQFISIICSFLTTIISLNWIELLIDAHWSWLDFIRPVINSILDFSYKILPLSLNLNDKKIDIKYITAVVLLFLLVYISRKILDIFLDLEVDYHNLNIKFKRQKENRFNKNLIRKFNAKEKKITKYMILINTQWKKNYFKKANDSLGEQNTIMNNFIYEQTGIEHSVFNNGFLYCFNNFEHLDNTLKVMFKLLKSTAPLDFAICIQVGEDLQLLKKLGDLKAYGKIIMAAETLYRYDLNKEKKYETQNVGIFQYENLILEVHEFKEKV